LSQAGSTVDCGCGKQLEVPSMRAIRELKPRAEQGPVSRKYEWNLAAGLTFVVGVVLAVVGAGVAIHNHRISVQVVDFDLPAEQEMEAWVDAVDQAPPEDLVDMWQIFKNEGLGDYQASGFVQARMASEWYAKRRNAGLIALGSGLAFAVTSFFLRGQSAR